MQLTGVRGPGYFIEKELMFGEQRPVVAFSPVF